MACGGNSAEKCGAGNRLSVYMKGSSGGVSTDGKCSANGKSCLGSGFGDCCSVKGNCGSSDAFCNTANLCQPKFGTCTTPGTVSTDGKCSANGKTCLGSGFGNCCSVKGNCGSSDAFCLTSNLCQPKYGSCTSPPAATTTKPTQPQQPTQPAGPGPQKSGLPTGWVYSGCLQ